MNNLPAPFPPLVSGGDGLDRYPAEPRALADRMARDYGVPADCVLPVRGLTHGLELVFRLAARDGSRLPRLSLTGPSPPSTLRPPKTPRPVPSSSAPSARQRPWPRWPNGSPPPFW